jgi:hypothetical protein
LLATDTAAQVVTREDGHIKILFLRSNTLMAQDFDMASLRLTSDPEAVAEPVGSSLAFAFFAASNATVAYRAPVEQSIQLQWFDRDGKKQAVLGEPLTRQSSFVISPDGQRALVSRLGAEHSRFMAIGTLARGFRSPDVEFPEPVSGLGTRQ